jgi:dolichol-phosphate mannosyltransferase
MNGVSVIIAAYNEEKNIGNAVNSVYSALKNLISDYEIIIIDDGSTDNTEKIIADLSKSDKKIKIITHPKNMGFGCAIQDGIKRATKKYITGFPGDNDMSTGSFRELIKARKSADLIISYMVNPNSRPFIRRITSRFFVIVMNILFGLNLKYFNGYLITRTKLVKSLPLRSNGLAIFAEVIVRLIKKGVSYKEVPFIHKERKTHKSNALTLISISQTLKTLGILVKDAYS